MMVVVKDVRLAFILGPLIIILFHQLIASV